MEPRRRFRFLKQLSEGTFGKVYMAEMVTDNHFSSVVAIKLLHGKWLGHEEIVQRSRDEARVLGLLHHRNIIRVEDLTSLNGQCAVIMEYLDGVDLKSLINYCAEHDLTMPRRVIFELIAATASALEAAYYREPLRGGNPLHLIHRDIKPSNVMVTAAGDIKVLDFCSIQPSAAAMISRVVELAVKWHTEVPVLIITRGAERDELLNVVRGLTAAMQVSLRVRVRVRVGVRERVRVRVRVRVYPSGPRCRARSTRASP